MAAAVEEFPEELMMLILLKLPVKPLFRSKCVQKSWYSLINSPQFVHLHRSSMKKNDCFLVRRFHGEEHVLSLHSYETLEDLGNQINIHSSFVGDLELCGSCDGLVCLSNYHHQILICNPTIRELRSLSVPPSFGQRPDCLIESVALGSDPNTGQYKVLMIGAPIHNYPSFGRDDDYCDLEARLYDLSTDSWSETALAFPPGPFQYSRRAVSFNGAFHWCPDRDDDSNNILMFHISNEVTGSIPMPDFVVLGVAHEKELCVSTKSQLSLVIDYIWEGRFEICVMTEYGVKESWTRLFNIGPLLPNNFEPIAFWDEQRLLLRNVEEGQLVSRDLQHHQNLCHFPIDGDFDLCTYSQSLVSVNGIRHPII